MSSVKRKSHFLTSTSYKRRRLFLQSGMKGFFCTCNGKERDCIREALNLLDEHAAKVYQKEAVEEVSQEEEIEDELQKEIEDLKKSKKPFEIAETEVKGCVFIKAMVDNPVELACSIFNEVFESKKRKSKFLIRLMPIEITCKAYIEDIKKTADRIFDSHFKCDPLTYAIIYNHRHNSSVVRMEVIESLCVLVRDRNVNHTVDIKNPTKAIVVEIIRGICCLSVVPNFQKFRKYNLVELASVADKANISLLSNESTKDGNNKQNSETQEEEEELQSNSKSELETKSE